MRPALALALLTACTTPSLHIEGLYDAAAIDAFAPDGGMPVDGGRDASMADGGCTITTPPSPAEWVLPDIGAPAGETVTQCLSRAPSPNVDMRIPEGQRYDLTTFGGGSDTQAVSCGGMQADGTWYYAANAQRFPCGQHVRIVDAERTRCVIVQVADIGPNVCVEVGAGAPIWDVSPLAAQHLFGGTSYGWSDRVGVIGAAVGSANALGDCDASLGLTPLAGFIGGTCTTDADCTFTGGTCRTAAQGFPGGYCTAACSSGSCPDRAGTYAYTGCADLTGDGDALCAARCDYTLFPTSGCRDGYGCYDRPHPTNPASADRLVCLPLPCE